MLVLAAGAGYQCWMLVLVPNSVLVLVHSCW
jgi:hypothetical protein